MKILFELVLIIAWIGLTVAIGYVAAPVLFAYLPKMTAGNLAGEMFHIVSYTGIAAALGLTASGCLKEKSAFFETARFAVLALGLCAVICNEFLITPVIVAHKTHTANWLLTQVGGSLAAWHGISQIIYLTALLCAVIFAVLWTRRLTAVGHSPYRTRKSGK